MMESVLVGTDIMPIATHLTASALSSAHPNVVFGKTQIITMPYGEMSDETGKPIYIGALDLIDRDMSARSLLDTGHREGLEGKEKAENENEKDDIIEIPHRNFDLVIMNPPYTKSTNHEGDKKNVKRPAVGGLNTTEYEQIEMTKKIKNLSRQRGKYSAGDGHAGLPTFFMDLADEKLKEGGVLALVVSGAFASGKSWKKMRNLLEMRYENIKVVSIAAAKSELKSFSADTGMAEVLIVASRRKKKANRRSPVTFVNIIRRPKSILESVEFARVIENTKIKEGGSQLKLGTKQSFGFCIQSTSGISGIDGSPGVSNVRDLYVSRMAIGIADGHLYLPRIRGSIDLPIVKLGELGLIGPVDRKIIDCFDKEVLKPEMNPEWPLLWAHNAPSGRESKMVVKPDYYGEIVPGQEGSARNLWRKHASKLCFNRDFQINSQRLAACITSEVLIGGTAWPNFKCNDERHEIPIVLWMNTILGLISFWCTGTRQHEGRARITVTRHPSLAILDVRELTDAQIVAASNIFDKFSARDMLPANEAWRDEVRQALDKAVLVDMLGLPESLTKPDGPVDLLRLKWCAEPSVHGGQPTRPPES